MKTVMQWEAQIQYTFLGILRQRLGRNKAVKDQLALDMGISTSAMYKRLNGQAAFSMGEMAYLMDRFQISVDEMVFQKSDQVLVQLPGYTNPVSSIEDFLYRLDLLMKGMSAIPNASVTYASREVPVFYYFLDPVIGAFKLFIYARTVWDLPMFQEGHRFSMSMFSEKSLESMTNLWDAYAMVPSSEIWNPNIWDNTLQQIMYILEIHEFERPEDALMLLDGAGRIIDRSRQMAESGYKMSMKNEKGEHLLLSNNRSMHSNSLIIAGNEERKMLFITHDAPNYIYSEDATLMEYTTQWMSKLSKRSTSLTGKSAVADREEYFRILQNKLVITRKRVEALIGRNQDIF